MSRSAQHFQRHWHDAYSIGFVARGAQRWRGRRGVVVGRAGDVVNTNPGEVHDGEPVGARQRSWIMFGVAPAAMALLTGRAAEVLEIGPPVISDAALRHALERAVRRVVQGRDRDGGQTTAPLGAEEALADAMGQLVANYSTHPHESPASDVAVRRMRERLADTCVTPTLGELAALVGLSRYQALRAFARCYGLPPYAWLISLRAERARAILRSGVTLAAAVAKSGFSDQSHMTRTFTRLYGYTPGAWRRAAMTG